jgi:hypothetical protein
MVFELWRQDDNGNRFLVAVFSDRTAAEESLAEIGRSLHRQIYWISEKNERGKDSVSSNEETPGFERTETSGAD